MKIYDTPGFPNPFRVRIVVAEKNLASRIEFVNVDIVNAEHKQPAFLAKNPTGTVPVLELDDGTFISECTAITEYLDNIDGTPTMTGVTPKERAVIHMMQRRAESEFSDAVGLYFHHATKGLGDKVLPYKSPDWACREAYGNLYRTRAENGIVYFDGVLRHQSFIAGDRFSMADATILGGLMHARFAGIEVPASCTALLAWKARMDERPSVKNPA